MPVENGKATIGAVGAPASLMRATDGVGITFCNAVLGAGSLHGVVNVQLGAFQWSPDGENIDPDLAIVARLRLDVACAQQLYTMLGQVLQNMTGQQPQAEQPVQEPAEKPN